MYDTPKEEPTTSGDGENVSESISSDHEKEDSEEENNEIDKLEIRSTHGDAAEEYPGHDERDSPKEEEEPITSAVEENESTGNVSNAHEKEASEENDENDELNPRGGTAEACPAEFPVNNERQRPKAREHIIFKDQCCPVLFSRDRGMCPLFNHTPTENLKSEVDACLKENDNICCVMICCPQDDDSDDDSISCCVKCCSALCCCPRRKIYKVLPSDENSQRAVKSSKPQTFLNTLNTFLNCCKSTNKKVNSRNVPNEKNRTDDMAMDTRGSAVEGPGIDERDRPKKENPITPTDEENGSRIVSNDQNEDDKVMVSDVEGYNTSSI